MPIGKYPNFDACVAANSDKSNPEAFCAWLEHRITGMWPGQMSQSLPEEAWIIYRNAYTAALDDGKGEKQAANLAEKQLSNSGWVKTFLGWERYFQAPKMRELVNVPVFEAGTHTDSSGQTDKWTTDDLDSMVSAFESGKVDKVPLKLGHSSDGFNQKVAEALELPVEVVTGEHGNGQMAIGWLSSLKRKNTLLIGSFTNVPEVIADMIEGNLYQAVSAEIDVDSSGPIITGVALLGVEEPAVDRARLDLAMVFGKPREHTHRIIFEKEEGMNEKITNIFKNIKDGLDSLANLFQEKEIPDYVQAYADSEFQGNVDSLIAWAGQVGFDACVASLSGKPGITDPQRLCGWLKARSGQHQEGEENMDFVTFVAAIAAMLGLEEGATPEVVLDALKAKLMPEETPPETPPEVPPEGEMSETVKNEFASMKSTIKNLEAQNAQFVREKRLNKYTKIVEGLNSIATEPNQAEQWADLEEKAGEKVVEDIIKQFQAANTAAEAAGIITPKGTSLPGNNDEDEFEKEVREYASDNKLTFEKALTIIADKKPVEFKAYHIREMSKNK